MPVVMSVAIVVETVNARYKGSKEDTLEKIIQMAVNGNGISETRDEYHDIDCSLKKFKPHQGQSSISLSSDGTP